jgi:ribosome biogenesis GTPase / thiamine phosphate phosphatase
MRGVVVKSTGSWYSVKIDNHQIIECRLKGKFKIDGIKNTNPLAVGDRVFIEQHDGDNVINEWEDRKNYIARESPKHEHARHIIAANLDQALLVATIAQPRTSTGFIDRFLVTATAYHIPTIILFNKADVYTPKDLQKLQEFQKIYAMAGVETMVTSTVTLQGIADLQLRLKEKTTLIAGHSGVGKSTLINQLSPSLNVRIGNISKKHEKGMHTTTYAEMLSLDFGGEIIDTPGIKEFGITDLMPEEIGQYFVEFQPIVSNCRFNNCQHYDEPNCAVMDAVENGTIHPERFKNYINILEDARKRPRYLMK